MGVPVDSPQHISFVLAISPFFTKQEDVLAGCSQSLSDSDLSRLHLGSCPCAHARTQVYMASLLLQAH